MVAPTPNPVIVFRGATAFFITTFYDPYGNIVQPSGGVINLQYNNAQGQLVQTQITLSPPAVGQTAWTGSWDSRGANPGQVLGSVHSIPGPPSAVTDFNFVLAANSANLPTF